MKKNLLILMFAFIAIYCKQANAQITFYVTDPPSLAGTHPFEYATTGWGHSIDTIFVHEELVFALDGTVDDSLACDTANGLVNAANVAGKIAVIYRGVCQFGAKALNAQNAGAKAVVIINNVSDPIFGPGAGDVGFQITIPVIMISDVTGALLRNEIINGNVMAMIGNKTGVFANDIGAYRPHIVNARSWAIPSDIAQNANQFIIPVGSWIHNYGQNAISNATLNATISLGGSVIYNETSSTISLNPGDSIFVSLPDFTQSSYANGLYRITYEYNLPGEDFPDDNKLETHFWIQPDHYSKSRWDTTSLEPIATSHIRTGSAADDFMWCVVLDHENTGNLTAYGMSFSTTAAAAVPGGLSGVGIQTLLFEWNDLIVDSLSFNSLSELTVNEYYDYIDNTLAGQFVTQEFATPIPLTDNVRYLACLRTDNADVFFGADNGINYETTEVEYNPSTTQIDDLSFLFPIRIISGGTTTWFSGFNSGIVPAIILHTSNIVGINEHSTANAVLLPYPNPGNEFITIPLSITYSGKVMVNVFDIAGRNVRSETVNMNNANNLRFNTRNLNNGLYYFNLKFSDESITSFPVVITK